MTAKIRVLVVEDSAAMRQALLGFLAEDPRIEVIGYAVDGLEAVDRAKVLRPDVITMDILMPNLDGVDATTAIMADVPARILVISSCADLRQVDLTFRAMSAGALEVLGKPTATGPGALRQWVQYVCDTICLMAEVPVITRRPRRAQTLPGVGAGGHLVDAIGVVASTGGPPALATLLKALPSDLPVPLLIAQHIAEGFTEGLVRWLRSVTALRVVIAAEGMAPRGGSAYFPPDGRDLAVGADGLLHAPTAKQDRHAPSGDRLLASLARRYGARAGGIVLTGMGDDGAEGLLAIRAAGGLTFVQSQASCVVFGMPQAALSRGAATHALSLESLVIEIRALAGKP